MLNPTRASFAFTHPACRSSARHGRLDNTKEGSADAQELAHSRHTSSSTWCVPSCPSPPHGRNQKYYIPPRRGFFLFIFGHPSLWFFFFSATSTCARVTFSHARLRALSLLSVRVFLSSHTTHRRIKSSSPRTASSYPSLYNPPSLLFFFSIASRARNRGPCPSPNSRPNTTRKKC